MPEWKIRHCNRPQPVDLDRIFFLNQWIDHLWNTSMSLSSVSPDDQRLQILLSELEWLSEHLIMAAARYWVRFLKVYSDACQTLLSAPAAAVSKWSYRKEKRTCTCPSEIAADALVYLVCAACQPFSPCLLRLSVLSVAEMSPTEGCEEERKAALEPVPWQLFSLCVWLWGTEVGQKQKS